MRRDPKEALPASQTAIPLWRSRWSAWALLVLALPVGRLAGQEVGVSPLMSEAVRQNLEQGQRALQDRQFEQASQRFQAAVESARTYQPQAREYALEATSRRNEGKLADAYVLMTKAIELAPQDANLQYMFGVITDELESYAEATEAYLKALELNPEQNQAATALWRIYEKTRRYTVAIDTFSRLAEQHPKNEWFPYYLGQAHLANGSPELALPAFREAIRINPRDWYNNRAFMSALRNSTVLLNREQEGLGLDIAEADSESHIAIAEYERLVNDNATAVPTVKLFLALLYVEDGQIDKALPLLRQLALTQSLDLNLRYNVAENLQLAARQRSADQQQIIFAEAAEQYSRVLQQMEEDATDRLEVLIEYGKTLVGAGKLVEGLETLEAALRHWHEKQTERPTQLYYELGKAYFRAGEQDLAEDYFRLFSRDVEAYFTFATRGTRTDEKLEALHTLADIYLTNRNYRSAADVLRRAVTAIDRFGGRLRVDPVKSKQFRLKLADALLHGQQYEDCIVELRKLQNDPDAGGQARRLLAEAHLGLRRHKDALEQLRTVEGTPDWNDHAMTLMADALMADGKYTEALKYLDQALQARVGDERIRLRRAQCLVALRDTESAAAAYHEILDQNPHAVAAWVGLGDMELLAARNLTGQLQLTHLTSAVEQLTRASQEDPTDLSISSKRDAATEQRIQADARLQAASERTRTILYSLGILAAITAPLIYIYLGYRKQWARRIFEEVLKLEKDLKQMIRQHVRHHWNGRWERLGVEDEFAGRFPYSYLRKKAEKEEDARDVLDVSNFGHLVAIVDTGWTSLGFKDRAKPKTRELVIAALSYVGNCRNAIFHSAEFQHELGGGRDTQNPTNHMNRQVQLSLKTIRDNFDLTSEPPEAAARPKEIPVVEAVSIVDGERPH